MSFTSGHALCIGIGSYQYEPSLNVPVTSADAEKLAGVLRNPYYCGYPENQVTLLSDSKATRDSILSALDELVDRTKPEDTLLFFYSGHGDYSADGVYHLTTHDTQLEQGRVKTGTAISQTELLDKLRLIPASRLVVIINACHAGEVSPVLGADQQHFTGQPFPEQAVDALLSTGSGRIIITACRSRQVSYIGHGTLTLFGQALIDGLQGQGISGQAGYISVFDLYAYLYFALEQAISNKKQEPELNVLKGVGPYPIALYRGATRLGNFPANHIPPKETAVRQVDPARSQWAFEQSVRGTGAVGITGNNNRVTNSGGNTLQAGGNINAPSAHGDKSNVALITIGTTTGNQGYPPTSTTPLLALEEPLQTLYQLLERNSPPPLIKEARRQLAILIQATSQDTFNIPKIEACYKWIVKHIPDADQAMRNVIEHSTVCERAKRAGKTADYKLCISLIRETL